MSEDIPDYQDPADDAAAPDHAAQRAKLLTRLYDRLEELLDYGQDWGTGAHKTAAAIASLAHAIRDLESVAEIATWRGPTNARPEKETTPWD